MLTAGFQFLFLFAFLIPFVLFILTQQNTLKTIQPDNRLMPPGQVWLQIIPFFGLFWQFVVVSRLAGSLKKQFARQHQFSFENIEGKNLTNLNTNPTYGIGITYCILFCCSIIPILGAFTALAGIICWIIYWVQLAGFKRKLYEVAY